MNQSEDNSEHTDKPLPPAQTPPIDTKTTCPNGHTDSVSDSSLSELSSDGERKQDTPQEQVHESGYNTECSNQQSVNSNGIDKNSSSTENNVSNAESTESNEKIDTETKETTETIPVAEQNGSESFETVENDTEKPKYRVDAEEFVPRAYRQYENLPVPNFPFVPICDVYPNFPNPAFLPPINFVPGFIPNQFFINQEQFYGHHVEKEETTADEDKNVLKTQEESSLTTKVVEKTEEAVSEIKTDPPKSPKNDNKTENDTSPRKHNEKRQNIEKSPKKLPIKPVTEDKTESAANTTAQNVKTEQVSLENNKKPEPTFSKMLKSSVSLIENKISNRPTYKKQYSYNALKQTTPLKESTNIKHYSDTLRKTKSQNMSLKTPETKKLHDESLKIMKTESKPVSQDSWISVSSRKKRKNKNGIIVNDSLDAQDENVCNVSTDTNPELELSIEESVAQIERTYELKQIEEQKMTINEPVEVVVKEEESKEKVEIPVIENVPVIAKTEKKVKKTEKTKTIKTNKVGKRILINDKELQLKSEIVKVEQKQNVIVNKPIEIKTIPAPETIQEEKATKVVEKIVETVQKVEILPEPVEIIKNEALNLPEPNITSSETNVDMKDELKDEIKTETSKSKKKKRKTKQKLQRSSSSPSNDETYEFLNENTFSSPESKTNVEVSLELDRMIQRGLYANLEEKLKTFNPSDSFIQSVSTEKFNMDIGNTIDNSAFKPVDKLKNFDFSGVLFNTTMNKTFEKLMLNKNENKNFLCDNKIDECEKKLENTNEPLVNGAITKAVKEWMNKTRENTPEVEILKSVTEIRSEYLICNDLSDSESDVDEEMPKNAEGLPVHAKSVNTESECTRESHENSPDLLDCWEPDIEIKNYNNEVIDVQKRQIDTDTVQTETCEEVFEVYESVYGKNEDYLRICKEAREKRSLNNFARDSGLPYRAICCNVM